MPTLTDTFIKKISAQPKRKEHRDGSLRLIVQPSGEKSFAVRVKRPNGEHRRIHLGKWDDNVMRSPVAEPVVGMPLLLVEAFQLAANITANAHRGRDVFLELKAAKIDRELNTGGDSFLACAKDFIEQHAAKKRGYRELVTLLGFTVDGELREGGLVQRWANRPIGSIKAGELHTIIEQARRHGTPGVEVRRRGVTDSRARKMHAVLSVMFRWCQKMRRIEHDPMRTLHAPPAPESRDRVLTRSELARLWAATATLTPPFGDCLRLLLLTGARLNEISRLRWSEVSEDGKEITLNGARTKNKKAFVIPLAPMARAIIKAQPRTKGFVFSTTNGERPISGWSKVKARLDIAMGEMEPWRIHDLRRSAATHMAEKGVEPHHIEAILNHISGAKASVAGQYNRAVYREPKRIALEMWAKEVGRIVGERGPSYRLKKPTKA